MDAESREWLRLLHSTYPRRESEIARLHEQLLRAAHNEVRRRHTRITGVELDDIAQQAASDATVAVLAKLATFRGDSRFTTWAYKFVILEVASKLGRHYWPKRHGREDLLDDAERRVRRSDSCVPAAGGWCAGRVPGLDQGLPEHSRPATGACHAPRR